MADVTVKSNSYKQDASSNYSSRPNEEKYFSCDEAAKAYKPVREATRFISAPWENTTVHAVDSDIAMEIAPSNRSLPAQMSLRMSNLVTESLLARVPGVTMTTLQQLPPEQAAALIARKFKAPSGNLTAMVVGDRASFLSTDRRHHVWADTTLEFGQMLVEKFDYRVCPSRAHSHNPNVKIATADDVLHGAANPSMGVRVGDRIEGSVYMSDRDCGVLLCRYDHPVQIAGQTYYPMIWLSDGLGQSFRLSFVLGNSVCGNLICWGIISSVDVHLKHTIGGTGRLNLTDGDAVARWQDLAMLECSTMPQAIENLNAIELGKAPSDVVDAAYQHAKKFGSSQVLGKQVFVDAIGACASGNAKLGTDWDSRTAGGILQGLTYLSQRLPHSDNRRAMDEEAVRWAAGFDGSIKIARQNSHNMQSKAWSAGRAALLGGVLTGDDDDDSQSVRSFVPVQIEAQPEAIEVPFSIVETDSVLA